MPYDQNGVYVPEHQTPQMPGWVQFDEGNSNQDIGQSAGSFVNLLRGRMSRTQSHGSQEGHVNALPSSPAGHTGTTPIGGAHGIGSGGSMSL